MRSWASLTSSGREFTGQTFMGWESTAPKHRADLRSERDRFQHIPEKAETQQQAREELSVSSSRDSSTCQPEVGAPEFRAGFFLNVPGWAQQR